MNPLWLDSFKDEKQANELFSTIGRLVYVCQRFETNCKRIATHIQFWSADDLFGNPESYTNFLNKIKTSTLNNNIKIAEKHGTISDPIETLNQARKSRNFIAHGICVGLENKFVTVNDLSKFDTELRHHTELIATGEFVSALLCGALLKDPLPNLKRINDTTKWVLNG